MQLLMDSSIQCAYFGCVLVLFLVRMSRLLQERHQLTQLTDVPPQLKQLFTQMQFEQKRRELLVGNGHSLITCIRSNVLLLLYAQLYSLVWSIAGRHTTPALGVDTHRQLLRTIVAMLLFNTVKTVVSIVSAIVSMIMERCHGFADTSLLSAIAVILRRFMRQQVVLVPMIAVQIWAFQHIGAFSLLISWVLSATVTFVFRTHLDKTPERRYKPFTDENLRNVLRAFASQVEFPLREISVVDLKTSHSKGIIHLTPLFNSQRIVISPTLLPDANRFTMDETAALLGIELAHWKLNHHRNMLLFSEIKPLIRATAVGFLLHYAPIYSAFGFNDQPVFMGAQLIQNLVCLPLLSTHRLCKRSLIRHIMFAADAFSAHHGYGAALQTALVKLDGSGGQWSDHRERKNHSPSLFERLVALDESMKKMS